MEQKKTETPNTVNKKKHTNRDQNQKNNAIFTKNMMIILLITALILALGYPVWVGYTDRMMAHQALREAKNVQLSMHLLSAQYYGEGTTPKSTATTSGLKPSAEKEILKLAGAEDGIIRIMKWDENNYEPIAFEYTTGNFFISYAQNDKAENQWVVNKVKKILTFS